MAVDVATKTAAQVFVDVVEEIDLKAQLGARPDLVKQLIDDLLTELRDVARDARREGRIL